MVRKDPDITFPNLFLLGDHLTRKWAKAKKGMSSTPITSSLHTPRVAHSTSLHLLSVVGDDGDGDAGVMPYNKQHIYWWAFPPLLLPVYFHVDNVRYVFQHKHWWDLFWIATYVRFTSRAPCVAAAGSCSSSSSSTRRVVAVVDVALIVVCARAGSSRSISRSTAR